MCPPHSQMTKPWETENAAFLTKKLCMQYQQLTVLPKTKFPSFYKNKICAFFSWLFHKTYMEWNQCNILSLNYCKEASARATFWEIRSCIGSCMKKAKLWFYLWQIVFKKMLLFMTYNSNNICHWFTSINGISNFDFVIVSYKKMYLST